MPTRTKPRPTPPTAPVDMHSLQHLNAHPALAPLLARRQQLRTQLTSLGEQRSEGYRERRALAVGDSMRSAASQRQLDDHLATIERQGGALEEQLGALHVTITATEEAVRQELRPGCLAATVQALDAYIAALEQLDHATQHYSACLQQNQRLLTTPLMPMVAGDRSIGLRLRQLYARRETLAAGIDA